MRNITTFDLIEHVRQPSAITCTSACLAMITDIDVHDIVKDFHDDWHLGQRQDPSTFLSDKGYYFEISKYPYVNMELSRNGLYLLTVPSLNSAGIYHHIIMLSHGNMCRIEDPLCGYKDLRTYVVWEPENSKEEKIKCWIVDIFIPFEELLSKRLAAMEQSKV